MRPTRMRPILDRALHSAFPGLLALALVTGCATGSQTPDNIHFHKERLTQYYESGQYRSDVEKVADEAEAWLSKRKRLETPGKTAVVFDIDETALSNWPSIKANDFGWITGAPCSFDDKGVISKPCGLGPWIQLARSEAIAPVLGVYQTSRRLGADVFFITGRPDLPAFRAATEKNLRETGFGEWAGLILKPTNVKLSTVEFKSGERKRIESQGWKVLASIGDQQSDLDGGFAEKTYLIPNPFYHVP